MEHYRKRGATHSEVAQYLLSHAKKGKGGCLNSPYPPFDYKRLPYSRIRVDGELVLTHRFIYSQLRGAIPEGKLVLHECDNARCINPAHLRLGTHTDNNRDCEARGRANRAVGDRNFNTRLKATDIPVIIQAVKSGRSMASIGKEYGVSASAICSIALRKSWKHVAIS